MSRDRQTKTIYKQSTKQKNTKENSKREREREKQGGESGGGKEKLSLDVWQILRLAKTNCLSCLSSRATCVLSSEINLRATKDNATDATD